MINVTAKDVLKLRQQTGAGMMDCKMALIATKGNHDEAVDVLRKTGKQIANKKASRETNQGLVGVRVNENKAFIVRVNCETDFVARNHIFQNFVSEVLVREESRQPFGEDEVAAAIAEVGENIKLDGMNSIQQADVLSSYVHNQVADNMGTIGVIVSLGCPPELAGLENSIKLAALGRTIAMHIAASNPKAITSDQLDAAWVEHEKKLFTEQAVESGKPENIVEKMVEGKMRKALREVSLVDQPFVVDTEKTVGQVLEEHDATVVEFVRLAVGE